MKIDHIKKILQELQFPEKWISDQTGYCILALIDDKERKGLLPEHKTLSQGARIHDILEYVRQDHGKEVAENTRESYRKTSLKPLVDFGLVVRHQLSTNDPNTYYRLHADFALLLKTKKKKDHEQLIGTLQQSVQRAIPRRVRIKEKGKEVKVQLDGSNFFNLSPGQHNLLEKSVVEVFGPAFLRRSDVVYLGDAARRSGYQNRSLMRRLNFPIDTKVTLPDVILFSKQEEHLVILEAVTSTGPIDQSRLSQLENLAKGAESLGFRISYVTAFPDRRTFRKFVLDIAWNTSVWIENEASNIIHFQTLSPGDSQGR